MKARRDLQDQGKIRGKGEFVNMTNTTAVRQGENQNQGKRQVYQFRKHDHFTPAREIRREQPVTTPKGGIILWNGTPSRKHYLRTKARTNHQVL